MSLFNGNSIINVRQAWLQTARSQINALTEDQILTVSEDELAERLIELLVPALPTIDRNNIEMQRDSRQSGGRHEQTRHYYEFFIPFDGPRELFEYQPTTATLGGVQLELRGRELVYRADAGDRNAEANLDHMLNEVERHLKTMKQDLAAMPGEIRRMISDLLPPRRKAIEAAREGLNNFKFKVRRREDAPTTYVAPEIKRKLVETLPAKSPAASVPEPILEEAEYQHILKVMDNMTHVMERSPKEFKELGEEGIRTHFLIQLNGQYEGQATGETFNAEGKTDILVRIEDKNVFIAECKFWKGEAMLAETIDQLLGYLTWRDAKTALVIFNRNKDFSAMIKTAVQAVKNHPSYKSGPRETDGTNFRFLMRNKRDADKEVIMTMMLYDIPTN